MAEQTPRVGDDSPGDATDDRRRGPSIVLLVSGLATTALAAVVLAGVDPTPWFQ
ncbi:hypothetical protein R4172_07995 [Rhodococcus kroppenstedtii]|uniref:hypothetical protein n=1 Tax=Rhodococcoides kroppenstedtii TaxID=293050 RepID=UPI002953B7CA|nr:hypothetical protein [Rhodococcus kroppenstedtii]MDV7197502.1 hypothetical protein [Rhodococcus kroppenstedtii]